MRGLVVLFGLCSTGCHMALAGLIIGGSQANGTYEAGAIATELGPDAVRTLACLDVGLAVSQDSVSSLLEMHVGNRCVHGEPFDLDRMVIRAKDSHGDAQPVALADPRREIARLHVGALERGHERIRLGDLDGVVELCFDLAATAPDAPQARPSPLCLDRRIYAWRARPTT